MDIEIVIARVFILLLIVASLARGAETVIPVRTLPEVVIHARLSGAQQLFSHESIVKSGARNAAEFLDLVAGISVRKDAVSGGKAFARIGGANTNQVAVLVDGLNIADIGSGESDLSKIPADRIESIEVVRGSSDAVAESIGGAILIRTKTPDADGLRAAVEASETMTTLRASREWSGDQFSASLDASCEQGNGDYRFRVTDEDGNGPFTVHLGDEFRRDNNRLLRDCMSGRVSRVNGAHKLLGAYGIERATFGLPGYLAPRPTPQASQSELSRYAQAQWLVGGEKFSAHSTFGYQSQSKDYRDPDPYSYLHESHESSTRVTLATQLSREFVLLSAGVEGRVERETLSSGVLENNGANRNRWRVGATVSREFALNSAQSQTISLLGNISAERFGSSNVQTLPGADLFYSNRGALSSVIGVRVSRAYRAPSFYSLFWNDELLAQGNPDLRPESATLSEAYARIRTTGKRATTLEIDAAHNAIDDLIYWRQAFDGRWTPQNLRRATLDNLTISLRQDVIPSYLDFECSMEWLEARDHSGERVTDGKYLIYRPARTFNARLLAGLSNTSALIQGQWIDKQAVLETNSKWLSAYTLLDAELSQGFQWSGAAWRAGLRCSNVLNTDYRIVRFAPMPLREYSLSLTCDFRSTKE